MPAKGPTASPSTKVRTVRLASGEATVRAENGSVECRAGATGQEGEPPLPCPRVVVELVSGKRAVVPVTFAVIDLEPPSVLRPTPGEELVRVEGHLAPMDEAAPRKFALLFRAGPRGPEILFASPSSRSDLERNAAIVSLGSDIAIGALDAKLTLPGEDSTLLAPKVYSAKDRTFHEASFVRLGDERLAKAVAISAVGVAEPVPSRYVLGENLRASSGEARLPWSEERPGPGRGEFLLLDTSEDIPIARVLVTLRSDTLGPLSFFIVGRDDVFRVSVSPTGSGPIEVRFPKPIRTPSLAVVLDEPQKAPRGEKSGDRRLDAQGIAALELRTTDDLEALDDRALVDRVEKDGAALALVSRAKRLDAGDAMLDRYRSFDASSRERFLGALASRCGDPALLARLLEAESTPKLVDRIGEALEGCRKGSNERAALETALETGLGRGSDHARAARRKLLASAKGLDALTRDGRVPKGRAELDLVRLLARRSDWTEVATKLAARLSGDGSLDDRGSFELVEPVKRLAANGDGLAKNTLSFLLEKGPAIARARAAELADDLPEMETALRRAAVDSEPRVREQAVRSLGKLRAANSESLVVASLEKDPWSFVRAEAAFALQELDAKARPAAKAALERAMKGDPSLTVREAARDALGLRPKTPPRPPVKPSPSNGTKSVPSSKAP